MSRFQRHSNISVLIAEKGKSRVRTVPRNLSWATDWQLHVSFYCRINFKKENQCGAAVGIRDDELDILNRMFLGSSK